MAQQVDHIEETVKKIEKALENKYVTQVEHDSYKEKTDKDIDFLKKIIYGFIGLIVLAVAGAALGSIGL